MPCFPEVPLLSEQHRMLLVPPLLVTTSDGTALSAPEAQAPGVVVSPQHAGTSE
jgi:hypothetical protein